MTPKSRLLIEAIAARAVNIWGPSRTKFDWIMDVECADEEAGLDLDGLAKASNMDFMHDLAGIAANLNRETRKLENCFVPRYSA